MKNIILLLTLLLFVNAEAANINRMSQDILLATQKVIEKQTITNPAAAGTADVLSANAGITTVGVAATVTSFVAQPDVPRNLVITPGTNCSAVDTGDVKVTGTNFFGETISETFNAASAGSCTAITGNKAFKTVTSVLFNWNAERGGAQATWSIGYGEKIGLKRCMDNKGDLIQSLLNGDTEGTAPTMLVSTVVENNTADFNGTMNGSNDFIIYFMQNYRCFP